MKETQNYNLKKPEGNDNVNIDDLNFNADKIDLEMKEIDTMATGNNGLIGTVTGLLTTFKTNLVGAINEIFNDLKTHKADYVRQPAYGIATVVNAKVITLEPVPIEYVDGMAISFKNATANTGAVTLNVNGLGAKTVLKANGSALASGNLKANSIYTVRYNGTNFILQGEGATGNATASDLLSGKTASTDAGDIAGTMPNRAGNNNALAIARSGSTLQFRAPNGYFDGFDDTVQYTDPNWISANILSGKSIFGVSGTAIDGAGMAQYAEGTATTSSTKLGFERVNGTNTQEAYLEVSGLSFQPNFIEIDFYSSYVKTAYSSYPFASGAYIVSSLSISYSPVYIKLAGSAYVNSTGFRLPVWATSKNVRWRAWK